MAAIGARRAAGRRTGLLPTLTALVTLACLGPACALRDLRSSSSKPKCICAFDFDNTLRVVRGSNQDAPAPEASDVLRACSAVPCAIGVASANDNTNKIRTVLQLNYGTAVFSDAFFKSGAFQYGDSDKSASLRDLASYHGGISASCIALFDDSEFNRRYATNIGAYFAKADPSTGVRTRDFQAAIASLPSYCFASGRNPLSAGPSPSPVLLTQPLPQTQSSVEIAINPVQGFGKRRNGV